MATPAPIPPLESQSPNTNGLPSTRIKGFGVECEIPLPKWAVAILGLLLIGIIIGIGAYTALNKLSDASIQIVPKDQQAAYLASTYHMQNLPDDTKDPRVNDFTADDGTTVTVNHFHKDGCVQVVRWNKQTQKAETKWLFGPSSAHTPTNAQHTASIKLNLIPEAQAQGRCIDPHPGAFQYNNQPVNQCLVQVWRYFGDGCVHYQFFNPCSGSWDVWPNGAPHVYWTRCLH